MGDVSDNASKFNGQNKASKLTRFKIKLAVHTYGANVAHQKLFRKPLSRFHSAKVIHYASEKGVLDKMFHNVGKAGWYSEDYRKGLAELRNDGITFFVNNMVIISNGSMHKIVRLAENHGHDIEQLINLYSEFVIPSYYREWVSKGRLREDTGLKSLKSLIRSIDKPENCLYYSDWSSNQHIDNNSEMKVQNSAGFVAINANFDLGNLTRRLSGTTAPDSAREMARYIIKHKREVLEPQKRIKRLNLEGRTLKSHLLGAPFLWVGRIETIDKQGQVYTGEMSDLSLADDPLHKARIFIDANGSFAGEPTELSQYEVAVAGKITIIDNCCIGKTYGIFKCG